MKKKKVIISGLPGTVSTQIAKAIIASEDFQLVCGISGQATKCEISGKEIELHNYAGRRLNLFQKNSPEIHDCFVVDFSFSGAIIRNAELYCEYGLPFIIGTTTTEMNRLEISNMVSKSKISAVVIPDLFQENVKAMIENIAKGEYKYDDVFFLKLIETYRRSGRGYSAKVETEVGASVSVFYVNDIVNSTLDLCLERELKSIRRDRQKAIDDIPSEYLIGGFESLLSVSRRGYSTVMTTKNLFSAKRTVVTDTLLALNFLHQKMKKGETGKLFTISEVITEEESKRMEALRNAK
jgi:4-hydroxy-tetrahydrodipicolinate reductase